MAKRSRTSSSIPSSKLVTTGDSVVDSAWREALAIRDLGASTRGKSQKRLAQAQAVKAQAEAEAITANKNYCVDARAEADDNLQRAELTLSKAERIRADAQEWVAPMEVESSSGSMTLPANERAHALMQSNSKQQHAAHLTR